jgi:hypothetical protein
MSVNDWAEGRRLHRAESLSIRAIVPRLGISRNTVRTALAGEEPTRYRRRPGESIVDAMEPQILVLRAESPDLPATVSAG